MRYIFLVLLLVGCGKTRGVMDAELRPYIFEFANDAKRFSVSTNIVTDMYFAEGDGKKGGTCHLYPETLYSSTINFIEIYRDQWEQFSEEQRRAVVYHELGHCHLFLKHDQSSIDCENSLMVPKIPSTECLKKNWDKYVNELFSKKLKQRLGF